MRACSSKDSSFTVDDDVLSDVVKSTLDKSKLHLGGSNVLHSVLYYEQR
jgi:hypothetical protein